MGSRLLISALSFLLLITTLPTFAGGRSDGGGNAVVCLKPNGEIESAELYDLYEGQALYNLIPAEFSGTAMEQAKEAANKIDAATGFGMALSKLIELGDKIHFLANGSGLLPIDDANPIAAPVGCFIRQLARYQDRTQELFIDSDIWAHLNERSRAALFLHEALYWNLRTYTEENTSDHTRYAVAAYFAKKEFTWVRNGLPMHQPVERCRSSKGIDKMDPLYFYAFRDPNKKNTVTLQFLFLGGKVMLAKTTADVDLQEWPFSKAKFEDAASARIQSLIEPTLTIDVKINQTGATSTGFIHISGDENPPTPFTCSLFPLSNSALQH